MTPSKGCPTPFAHISCLGPALRKVASMAILCTFFTAVPPCVILWKERQLLGRCNDGVAAAAAAPVCLPNNSTRHISKEERQPTEVQAGLNSTSLPPSSYDGVAAAAAAPVCLRASGAERSSSARHISKEERQPTEVQAGLNSTSVPPFIRKLVVSNDGVAAAAAAPVALDYASVARLALEPGSRCSRCGSDSLGKGLSAAGDSSEFVAKSSCKNMQSMLCNNCDEYGHKARDCPHARVSRGGPEYYICPEWCTKGVCDTSGDRCRNGLHYYPNEAWNAYPVIDQDLQVGDYAHPLDPRSKEKRINVVVNNAGIAKGPLPNSLYKKLGADPVYIGNRSEHSFKDVGDHTMIEKDGRVLPNDVDPITELKYNRSHVGACGFIQRMWVWSALFAQLGDVLFNVEFWNKCAAAPNLEESCEALNQGARALLNNSLILWLVRIILSILSQAEAKAR